MHAQTNCLSAEIAPLFCGHLQVLLRIRKLWYIIKQNHSYQLKKKKKEEEKEEEEDDDEDDDDDNDEEEDIHYVQKKKHPLLFSCVTLRKTNQLEFKFQTK